MNASPLAQKWTNKALFRLIWPLLIEQLLVITMGTVDTVMISTVGESAVSGVSLVDQINLLLINLFYALSVGGAVVVSQYIGRGENKKSRCAARQLVYAVMFVTLIFATVVLLLRSNILVLIYGDIAPDVMGYAQPYLIISAISYPFIGLHNALMPLFRSMGNSKIGMFVALMVNILNILGNSLFIYGFGWGTGGAALSTLISRATAAIVLFVILIRVRHGPVTLIGIHKLRLDFEMIRRILRVAVPSGIENSLFQMGRILVVRIVATFGTAAIAGNAVANLIGSYSVLPGMAFSMSLLTVVGQFVGAKEFDGAKRITRKILIAAFITLLPINIGLFFASGSLLQLFSLSAEGLDIGVVCLQIYCIFMPFFWITSFALPNALRAAGDVRFPLVVSILTMGLCRVGMSIPLSYMLGLGVLGVWIAMIIDWIVRSIIFVIRWRHGKWQTKHVID